MAVIRCKMCGGSLNYTAGASVCECEYCGSLQTLPRLHNGNIENLYDRAGHYRRSGDFDKAIDVYEQILNADPEDAEAYWSLVLCRYGIEYVEDPDTHRRVPTVNRAQLKSIYADEDYKAALAHADPQRRAMYEKEAAAIEEIQKGILAISSNEKPYDVFICYKETDDQGQRTRDSVWAQEIYYTLTEQGYKVFFSRISLEDKLGQQYEPYIFAALHSSRVMLAIGSKAAYFNSAWVKNEWGRFLKLAEKDRKRLLIPCFRDMDPYDLPEELSILQSQDMGRIGFMQDLLHGIKKVLGPGKKEPAATKEAPTVRTEPEGNPKSLIKRGYLYLEDGEFKEADRYFERALDLDPENAKGYLGKLYASEGVRDAAGLQKKHLACLDTLKNEQVQACEEDTAVAAQVRSQCPNTAFLSAEEISKALQYPREHISSLRFAKAALSEEKRFFDSNRFYVRAKQFAKDGQAEEVNALRESVLGAIRARIEEETRNDAGRSQRVTAAYKAHLIKRKEELQALYLKNHELAYVVACSRQEKANDADAFEAAAKKFEELKDYKDSAERRTECLIKASSLRKKANPPKKRKKSGCVFVFFLIAIAVAGLYLLVLKDMFAYNAAGKLYASGRYEEALTAYTALGEYKDSADLANKCREKMKSGGVTERTVYDSSYEPTGKEKLPKVQTGTVVCVESAAVRSGPNSKYTQLATVSSGNKVTVSAYASGWYYIEYKNTRGWISGGRLFGDWMFEAPRSSFLRDIEPAKKYLSSPEKMIVTASNGANLREGAASVKTLIDRVGFGETVVCVGSNGDWRLVCTSLGKYGWININSLKKK